MERNLYVYIGIIVLEILMCFVTAVAASCVVYEVWKSIKERSLPGKKFGVAAGIMFTVGIVSWTCDFYTYGYYRSVIIGIVGILLYMAGRRYMKKSNQA